MGIKKKAAKKKEKRKKKPTFEMFDSAKKDKR